MFDLDVNESVELLIQKNLYHQSCKGPTGVIEISLKSLSTFHYLHDGNDVSCNCVPLLIKSNYASPSIFIILIKDSWMISIKVQSVL